MNYTFMPHPNSPTDIGVDIVRDGKNLKGRLLGFVLGTVGDVLEKAIANSVKASKPPTEEVNKKLGACVSDSSSCGINSRIVCLQGPKFRRK